jgi:hypothetical protein
MTQRYIPTAAQPAPAGFSLPDTASPSPNTAERWQPPHHQRETLL